MRPTRRTLLSEGMLALILVMAAAACGDPADDTRGSTSDLVVAPAGPADPAGTESPDGADDPARDRSDDPARDRSDELEDADDIAGHRIQMRLAVRAVGDRLALDLAAYNPADCDWVGHLFIEHQLPPRSDSTDARPRVKTVARFYRVRIPSGATLSGTIEIARPQRPGHHGFFARAYHPEGGDREAFFNALIEQDVPSSAADERPAGSGDAEAEVVMADDVLEGSFEVDAPDDIDDRHCAVARERIDVDLRLRATRRAIYATTGWNNETNRRWRGDLYVDVAGPGGGLRLLRRDLGVAIGPNVGFSTRDRIRRPERPGRYVFTALALRRDGSAAVRWVDPGTTEIFGVCNAHLCELIRPRQQRARISLRGPSSLHLESDFFSEHTRVTLAYDDIRFDITDLCRIEQQPGPGGSNYTVVSFNTNDLPIGGDTIARYAVALSPMPPVPPGAKLEDGLWIRTNGPPPCSDPSALSADCE